MKFTGLAFFSVMYIAYVVELTLLTREADSRVESNLKLLGTYAPNPWAQTYMLENFMMFIPLGIILALVLLKIKRIWICFAISAAFSLGIEITQYLTQRGYFQVAIPFILCYNHPKQYMSEIL